MKKTLFVAATLLATGATVAEAQSPSAEEVNNYFAVASTPAGALAPILTNTLVNRLQNGGSLALRYGNLSSGDFNPATHAVGVTGILPAGLGASFSVTGGVIMRDCNGCSADLMLGVGGDTRITGMSMGTTSTSPLFTVSVAGELGYGRFTEEGDDDVNMISGYVGLPVALIARGTGMQFVPFITPGYAFSRSSASGQSTSGSGIMLGGGLGIYNRETNVSVNVGIQHSFINGARNTLGINVVIGGR